MIALRMTKRADADVVRAIRLAAADHLTALHGRGHWSEVFTIATIRKHVVDKPVYLVEQARAPIATFELQTLNPNWYNKRWFANPGDPAHYLFNMAVLPASQRQGIGSSIMAEIEQMTVQDNRSALRFDAYDAAAGAGTFYEKCGYRKVHSGPFNGVALIYFEKVLP